MTRTSVLAGALSGFLGGIAGAYVLGHGGGPPVVSAAAAAGGGTTVSASRLRLVDEAGRTRAELAMSPDGGPGLFFYDGAGRNRLVLGLYAPAESEHPFVVLNDAHGAAAEILRLFGPEAAPVVVLKHGGADRSIYGLHPVSMEPFLVNYAADRKKTAPFGSF